MAQSALAMAGVVAMNWHYGLESISQRMGDLHASIEGNPEILMSKGGNVWLHANSWRIDADRHLGGSSFTQDSFGFTAGMDKGVRFAGGLGLFGGSVGINRSDIDFDHPGESRGDGIALALYATWMRNGWHVDLAVKVDTYENTIDSPESDGGVSRTEYDSMGYGMSFEAGRRFAKGSFWFEPALQAAVARFDKSNFTTSKQTKVEIGSSTAAQYRGQLRAGMSLAARRLWPYVKAGETYAAGGDGIVVMDDAQMFNTQFGGWRFEAGAGIVWVVRKNGQAYFDYEYAKADYYKRPWSFALGYRYVW
jgi:outer membrane autotransporter protein